MQEIYTLNGRACVICGQGFGKLIVKFADDTNERVLLQELVKLSGNIPEELYLDVATLQHPKGKECGVCGHDNTFVDDCGWFYILYAGIPCCKDCWWGPVGDKHRELFGVGDR